MQYGYSTATTSLRADSTFSQEHASASYCALTGTWTVSGNRFTANTRSCGGTVVLLTAAFSRVRLSGTFSGGNAEGTGTFTLSKQPDP